jgi:copper chaperone NosL
MWHKLAVLALLWLLTGCSTEPDTGPAEVKWDRDNCERCRMVLSDPHYAAEVRYFPEGKRSKVAKFDDIGCAALWLQEQPWRDSIKSEIWVADHRTREWIDAATATYVSRKTTPMEYGLGAQSEPAEGGLNFAQAKLHIAEVEAKYNLHGQQLQQRLQQQAKERENSR